MKIKCPFCDQGYDIEASMLGVEGECENCGNSFVISEDVVCDKDHISTSTQEKAPQGTKIETKVDDPYTMAGASFAQETKTTLKPLTCDMCGSSNIIKQDGIFVCQSCGTKYSVEEAKKMMASGTVNISGVVKVDETEKLSNLYKIARRAKAEDNYENAAKYYNMIIVEDPNSWEASFFSVYYKAMDCKIAEIASAALSVANSLKSVFPLISDFLKSTDDRERAIDEIYEKCFEIVNGMCSAATAHHNEIDWKIRSEYESDYANRMWNTISILILLGDQLEKYSKEEGDKSKKYLNMAADSWKEALKNVRSSVIVETEFPIETYVKKIREIQPEYQLPVNTVNTGGCYIATAVYGSYDCPQVWTLRRYRDNFLAKSLCGRLFIHVYYAISPILVCFFGNLEWFKKFWKKRLDRMVERLNAEGVDNTPYRDKKW
jgi:ribosomal protein L37AE/L43A